MVECDDLFCLIPVLAFRSVAFESVCRVTLTDLAQSVLAFACLLCCVTNRFLFARNLGGKFVLAFDSVLQLSVQLGYQV
jgi:hypothetical protein